MKNMKNKTGYKLLGEIFSFVSARPAMFMISQKAGNSFVLISWWSGIGVLFLPLACFSYYTTTYFVLWGVDNAEHARIILYACAKFGKLGKLIREEVKQDKCTKGRVEVVQFNYITKKEFTCQLNIFRFSLFVIAAKLDV